MIGKIQCLSPHMAGWGFQHCGADKFKCNWYRQKTCNRLGHRDFEATPKQSCSDGKEIC